MKQIIMVLCNHIFRAFKNKIRIVTKPNNIKNKQIKQIDDGKEAKTVDKSY